MRGTHGAKAYAPSTGANATCGDSSAADASTLQATEMAATTKPTATKASTTSAVMPSRPCYGTDSNGCNADYQSNYLLYFHALKFDLALIASDCASAGFCGAT